MVRRLLTDEFHLSLFVPRGFPETESAAIRRTLGNAGFRAALRRAVRQTVRQFHSLNKVRVRLSR